MVIAMILSVHLSVCLSVTLCYNVNKRRPTIMQFLPNGSLMTLVFGSVDNYVAVAEIRRVSSAVRKIFYMCPHSGI